MPIELREEGEVFFVAESVGAVKDGDSADRGRSRHRVGWKPAGVDGQMWCRQGALGGAVDGRSGHHWCVPLLKNKNGPGEEKLAGPASFLTEGRERPKQDCGF